MESMIFLVILVVASLLRGSARQKGRQPAPPMRPKRPTLEAEPQQTSGPGPAARPGRRTIFDETIYMFPKKRVEREAAPVQRQEPVSAGRQDPAAMREEPKAAPVCVQRSRGQALFQDRDALARGIILAEVLGPPLSKRKKRGFI